MASDGLTDMALSPQDEDRHQDEDAHGKGCGDEPFHGGGWYQSGAGLSSCWGMPPMEVDALFSFPVRAVMSMKLVANQQVNRPGKNDAMQPGLLLNKNILLLCQVATDYACHRTT